MLGLIIAVIFTLATSALCSLLEAFILSLTPAEIEVAKKKYKKKGLLLEKFKNDIEETSSAILTLNTVANTLGATLTGYLAGKIYDDFIVGFITGGLVLGILIFSEIIPKNLGVIYKNKLVQHLVLPLQCVRFLMFPLARLAKLCVRLIIKEKAEITPAQGEAEILLLTEKQAKDGALTKRERDMVFNSLKLNDITIKKIMTPRTVVTAFDGNQTIEDIFKQHHDIPFARIPVYEDTIDKIIGLVRRRKILAARVEEDAKKTLKEIMSDIIFIPDSSSAADALQYFLKNQQQLAIVVDEFGSTAGVIALEDIIENIIGHEIFEEDDVAIDMRQFAKDQAESKNTLLSSSIPS